MQTSRHPFIKQYLITILFFLLPLLFPLEISAAGHPSLIINPADIQNINQRINNDGVVKEAFYSMNRYTGNPDKWAQELIENSFHTRVSGSSQTKNIAKEIYNKYTNGEKRYNFELASNNQNYGYAPPCAALALAYDLLYPDLSETEKNNGKTLLSQWGEGIYQKYRYSPEGASHNFSTGIISCLGLIGLALKDEAPNANAWTTFSKNALANHYLNFSFNKGGDYWEGNMYLFYGSGPTLAFLAAYEKNQGVNLLSGTNLDNFWDHITYVTMPDGKYARYGDNPGTILKGEMLYILNKKVFANNPKAPAYLWAWQKIRGLGASQYAYPYHWNEFDHLGIVLWYPQSISAQAPDSMPGLNKLWISQSGQSNKPSEYPADAGGMASLRTGWTDAKNITLWIVNRWRWQNHQHYDPSHFLLYAFGDKIVSYDNNRNYDDPLRGKISQQNTILIDKDGPLFDVPRSNFTTGANSLLGFYNKTHEDNLSLSLTSDSKYPHIYFSTQGLPNANYSNATTSNVTPADKADRTFIILKEFLSNPYSLILDDFQMDSQLRDYTFQIYIPANHAKSGLGTAQNPFAVSGPNTLTKIVFSSPNPLTLNLIAKPAERDDQAVQVSQYDTADAQFLTALFPSQKSSPANISMTEEKTGNLIILKITESNRLNKIVFNKLGTNYTYEDIQSDAGLTVISYINDSPNKYYINSGKSLSVGANSILSLAVKTVKSGELTAVPAGDCPLPCPAGKPEKHKGNADCDDKIDLMDFAIWLNQHQTISASGNLPASQRTADFNCREASAATQTVNIDDYNLWKETYFSAFTN